MASSSKKARSTARSRRRSVNERHFEKVARTPGAARRGKPAIAEADGRVASVTYEGKLRNGSDLVLTTEELYKAPALAGALAAAFPATYGKGRPLKVLRQFWKHAGEFAGFMGDRYPTVTPEQLERRHLTAFRDWLNERVADGTTKRSKPTRSVIILGVQRLLRNTGRCDHVDFIKRPYASVGRGNLRATPRKPRRRVPKPDETGRLMRAALREIEETMTLRAAFLDSAHPKLADCGIRATVALAHRLRETFGCRLPDGATLRAFAHAKGHARASTKKAISAYMPTRATIAPFCILLMTALRLDGQMLADLLKNNVEPVTNLGVRRLQATVWRSKVKEWKTTTATLSGHWHSPEKLVEFIDGWSSELRDVAPARTAARQFLVASLGAARGVVTLDGKQGIGRAVTDFCERNGLPVITSSIPRKIAIDLVDMLSGGDVETRARTGGNSGQVSLQHYDTPEAAARGDDAYGVGMMLLSAHRHDHGLVPDKRSYLPDEDVMAATPGWWCANPFDPPPGTGQVRTRPCAAYGRCPTCSNGEPRLDDPVSCKRVGLLLEAILRSEPNMPPDVWEGTWKPIADEVAFKYIPMFEALPHVTAAAALLDIGPMMEVVSAQDI